MANVKKVIPRPKLMEVVFFVSQITLVSSMDCMIFNIQIKQRNEFSYAQ